MIDDHSFNDAVYFSYIQRENLFLVYKVEDSTESSASALYLVDP